MGRGPSRQLLASAIALGALAIAGSDLVAQSAPSRPQAVALLGALDAAIGKGKLDEYFARFSKSCHQAQLDRLRSKLTAMLASPTGATATTTTVTAESTISSHAIRGSCLVAGVDTVFTRGKRKQTIRSYTAIRLRGRQPEVHFSIQVGKDAPTMDLETNAVACPACNYRIQFDQNWLAVPIGQAASGCMEATLLLSLTDDVHIELAVHVGESAVPAKKILVDCMSSAFSQDMLGEKPPSPSAWKPDWPEKLSAGVSSGRFTCNCRGGAVAEMNVISIGRLRYLMVVRGSEAVVTKQRKQLDALLSSFRLIDPTITAATLGKRATHMHTGGGEFDGNTYRNPKYRLSITGPMGEGWKQQVRAGGFLFQLSYARGDDRLLIRALRSSNGRWSRDQADSMIRRSLTGKAKLKGEWSESETGGFSWRTICTDEDHLAMRLALREDVLIILKGRTADEATRLAVEAAMKSLKSTD